MDLNNIIAAITALADSNNRLAEANFALAQAQSGEGGDDTGAGAETGTTKRKRRTKAEIAAEEAAKTAAQPPAPVPPAPVTPAPVTPTPVTPAPVINVTDAVIVTPAAAAQPPAPAFAAAVAAPVAAPVAAAPVAAGDPGAAATFTELLTVFQQGAGGKPFQEQVKGALVERVAAYGLTMPISDIENPMLPGAGYASLAYAARFDITQHVKAAIAHYSGAAAAAPAAGI